MALRGAPWVTWNSREPRTMWTRISQALYFADDLSRPRFGLAGLLAGLTSIALCWPTWPGYMSFDSLFAWKESLYGVETSVWPPMQAYLTYLSRTLTEGPGGFFFAQTFVLFFSAAVIFSLYVRRTSTTIVAFAAFVGLFIYFPTMIGVLAVIWKDVTTASFALLGVMLWLLAVRYRSWACMISAGVAFSVATAMRYNALPLMFPIFILMITSPFGKAGENKARLATCAILAVAMALAFSTTIWRLPDFHRLPAQHEFASTQEFDLLGITACSGKSYIPAGMSSGIPLKPDQARLLYDPRHLQMAFRKIEGIPRVIETDANGAVPRMWSRAIKEQFGCYLSHRTAVFREQMGLVKGEVFYPTHGTIDANPYGIRLAHPAASARFNAYVQGTAAQVIRRAVWLYLVAPLAVVILLVRAGNGAAVATAMTLGGLAYPAVLYPIAPAGDARYIFPSNTLCIVVIVLGGMVVIQTLVRGRRSLTYATPEARRASGECELDPIA